MQFIEKKAEKKVSALAFAHDLVENDFNAVNNLIKKELHSDVALINEIVEHLIDSGGKRLRPLLLLLIANNLGYHNNTEHHELATIIEFIHTSTLLHDDVVDDSSRRRHQATANALWGNAASVLAGDFLYSRAFQILARRSNIPIMKLLADVMAQLSEGEVMQLVNRSNSELSEADYFEVIRRKTAQLYAAACEIGAIIAKPNDKLLQKMANAFGLHLGMAFQMTDDLLDYTADAQTTGKNLGDDLAEGKMTLPLIYALQHGNNAQQEIIRQAIAGKGRELIAEITTVIQACDGCGYTLQQAKQQIKQAQHALNAFPANPYRDALQQISDFVITRNH